MVEKLAELGAYGLTFHDDDLFAFGSSDGERQQQIDRLKAALQDTGLIVPMVTKDDKATVVAAEPYLDSDAVAAIEDALRALGVTGGADQVHRIVVPSLPVATVLAVGLGAARDDWPADKIRRAAGVAGRSLDKAQSVVTTLSALDLAAAVEGLILGAYRFNDFRSAKTAPKEPGLREIEGLRLSGGRGALLAAGRNEVMLQTRDGGGRGSALQRGADHGVDRATGGQAAGGGSSLPGSGGAQRQVVPPAETVLR